MAKPSKGTPADKRLKANKAKASTSKAGAKGSTSKPAFGSAAFRAKYNKKG